MSTLDRLRQLVKGSGPTKPTPPASALLPSAPPQPVRELTYEPLDEYGQPMPERPEVPALPGASMIDTPAGRCVVIDHVFEADSSHGRLAVEQSCVAAPDVIAFCESDAAALVSGPWGEGLGRAEMEQERDSVTHSEHESDAPVVFLDLETTGLSGGAGTVAFLCGCGYFRAGAFHTRQFFLTGFAHERALLHAVTGLLADAACLVTYNGKTFDVPVMETRWAFHRVPPPWTDLTHLDMVHVSRRLWRARGDLDEAGCRLVALERDLFGVIRHGDVDGFEIPGRYFEYIRHGDASLLEPVLHHNRLDLLSLACLTSRALQLVREGAPAAHNPRECLALGRELARLRDDERADDCFREVAESPFASTTVRADALYAIARRLRRARRYQEAADVWRRLMAVSASRADLHSEAREALAVHYEHRDRNLSAAHEWATAGYRTAGAGPRREAFAHRLTRLKRKMAAYEQLNQQPTNLVLWSDEQ